MGQIRFALCGLVLFTVTRFAAAQSRGCTLPISDAELQLVIGDALKSGDTPTRPNIDLVQVHYVCESSAMFRGYYRGVSLLATYNCTGSVFCRGGVGQPSQFDFECDNSGDWSPVVQASADSSFVENPEANFSTPTDTMCSLCINPARPLGMTLQSDPLTHCVGKKHVVLPPNSTATLHTAIALHCVHVNALSYPPHLQHVMLGAIKEQ